MIPTIPWNIGKSLPSFNITEMVELLKDYADKMLAEDCLNCGQPDLSIAAKAWAQSKGYAVLEGSGSHLGKLGI